MEEWKECTLSDLGTIVGGATPSTKDSSNYENGSIAWITPKDLSTHTERFISHGERNITEKGLKSCSAQLMPPNSILFTSRAPIGYIAIAKMRFVLIRDLKVLSQIRIQILCFYIIS